MVNAEISLDGDHWNDGLLATIREQVLTIIWLALDLNVCFVFSYIRTNFYLFDLDEDEAYVSFWHDPCAYRSSFFQVHMEVDRKAVQGEANASTSSHPQEKITYKVGTKVMYPGKYMKYFVAVTLDVALVSWE